MKKIILFATIVLMAFSASAQVKLSRTFDKKTFKMTPATWYIRAGINTSFILGEERSDYNKYEYGVGAKVGFDLATGFRYMIKKSPVYWGAEFGLASRGFSSKEIYNGIENNASKYSCYSYNIKFAPMIGVKNTIVGDYEIDFHIGPFLSYDFIENKKESYVSSYNYADFEPFDAGFQVGVGLWYKKYNVDVTWQLGLLECADAEALKSSHNNHSALMIRFGYEF